MTFRSEPPPRLPRPGDRVFQLNRPDRRGEIQTPLSEEHDLRVWVRWDDGTWEETGLLLLEYLDGPKMLDGRRRDSLAKIRELAADIGKRKS